MLQEGVLREDGWHGKVSPRGAILQEIVEQEVIPEERLPHRGLGHGRLCHRKLLQS